jgi:CRISPR system Cascade subunit CasD
VSTTGEVVPRERGNFLTCVLAAPIAAMGALAVGERRGTWDRPGRSAVLGLVAACLGIEREDEDAHQALEAGYGMALRVERLGPVLADYHTAQVPPARRGRVFRTRREELAALDLGTILSRRDYHVDVVVFVALWPREAAPRWPLKAIAEAMQEPQFVPYLGRRACPLMLPLSPEIEAAADPAAALAARAERDRGLQLLSLRPAADPVVTLDAADARLFGIPYRRVEPRATHSPARKRWQSICERKQFYEGP